MPDRAASPRQHGAKVSYSVSHTYFGKQYAGSTTHSGTFGMLRSLKHHTIVFGFYLIMTIILLICAGFFFLHSLFFCFLCSC